MYLLKFITPDLPEIMLNKDSEAKAGKFEIVMSSHLMNDFYTYISVHVPLLNFNVKS